MEDLTKVLEQLRKPFPASNVKLKIQAMLKNQSEPTAIVVAYIDARDVMDRLDEVFGLDWQDSYRPIEIGGRQGIECTISTGDIYKTDVGDLESMNDEVSLKAGYSDAFKRAAVKFGIGRFLYDLPRMYAKTDPNGKYILKEEVIRLSKMVEKHVGLMQDVNAANKKVEKVMKEPSKTGIPEALVERGLTKNVISAKNTLKLSNLSTDVDIETATKWFELYRTKRAEGLKSHEAADFVNAEFTMEEALQ